MNRDYVRSQDIGDDEEKEENENGGLYGERGMRANNGVWGRRSQRDPGAEPTLPDAESVLFSANANVTVYYTGFPNYLYRVHCCSTYS